MSAAWSTREVNSASEFLETLKTFIERPEIFFRGQENVDWPLSSTLERRLAVLKSINQDITYENDLINQFVRNAFPFFGHLEQRMMRRYPGGDRIAAMTIMRHYGAPTRLLDWSISLTIAAYFACIGESENDGVIWWFNAKDLSEKTDSIWDSHQIPRDKNGNIDYHSIVFSPNAPAFVGTIALVLPFERAQAQRGHFTIGSRIRMPHDDVIALSVADDERGKIVIPSRCKRTILDALGAMGIDSISLQHAGADIYGLSMSQE